MRLGTTCAREASTSRRVSSTLGRKSPSVSAARTRSFLERYANPEEKPQDFCREFDGLSQVDRDACLTNLIEQASKATVKNNEKTRGAGSHAPANRV